MIGNRMTHFFADRSRSRLSALTAIVGTAFLLLSGCAATTSTHRSDSSGASGPAAPSAPSGTRQVDPALVQRLQQAMVPLIQHMNHPLPLTNVRIGIIDSQEINAANAGGGQFYVTMGLLQRANDEQLRGVLAHEIAHADLNHVAKAKALGTGVSVGSFILGEIIPGGGILAPLAADLGVMKPYSRKEEYEADAHGVEILNRSGYDGRKVMADTLTWLLQASGPSGGFFSTHPGTSDRIARVEKMG